MDQPPHNANHAINRHETQPPPRGPDPDAHLLARHQAGDPEALGDLLHAHADRLYRLCLRMTRNHATAEELTQDAMVRIIAGLPQFDGRAWFKSWITRITVNVCISHLRHISGGKTVADGQPGRQSSYFGRGGDETIPTPEDSREPDPAQRVQSSEDMADLLDALDRLEPEPRALLILRDQHGHDYERLAEVFAVPVGTIKSRLFRARTNLREAIEAIRNQRRATAHQHKPNNLGGKES
jgi:RNA polymerase sigma-70 factor (ECF subfamily)